MSGVGQDLSVTAAWLNERGYVVNNCFQLPGGRWRVNVRREDWATAAGRTHEYAEGATLSAALGELVSKRVTAEARLVDAIGSLLETITGERL